MRGGKLYVVFGIYDKKDKEFVKILCTGDIDRKTDTLLSEKCSGEFGEYLREVGEDGYQVVVLAENLQPAQAYRTRLEYIALHLPKFNKMKGREHADKIRQWRKEGLSWREIKDEMTTLGVRISYEGARNWLMACEDWEEYRSVSSFPKGKKNGRWRHDVDTQDLVRMRREGMSYKKIASQVGMSIQGVVDRIATYRPIES